MPSNQRRGAQTVPVVYICVAVAVLICAGTFAIKTLMLKQQLKEGGERLARLRKELAEVTSANDSLRTRKNQLTSVAELKKAIKAGIITLKPIDPAVVVNIPADRRITVASAQLNDPDGGR